MMNDKERIQAAIAALEPLSGLPFDLDVQREIEYILKSLNRELEYPYDDPSCVCKSCGIERAKGTSAQAWEYRGGMCGHCYGIFRF